jgi:DNA-binding response OmpR family regulator
VQEAKDRSEASKGDRLSSGARRRPRQAFVVEDVDDLRTLYASDLEAAGFVVSQAAAGDEAMVKLRAFEPEVIVLDLALPAMNGLALAKYVRHLEEAGGRRRAVILVVSALRSRAIHASAIGAGCDAFLPKPIDSADIVKRALALCEERGDAP